MKVEFLRFARYIRRGHRNCTRMSLVSGQRPDGNGFISDRRIHRWTGWLCSPRWICRRAAREGTEIEKTKIKSKILPATEWNSVLVSTDEGEIYFWPMCGKISYTFRYIQ